MVAQTRHSGQPSPKKKLAFHEKLGGKGLSTDALLKKLKTLHTQLAALDQDTVDVASLSTARKELINTSILLHKDRGVKAFAACCLADILRLYAPDAPYTQAELRDIFQFFFRQLSNGLKGPESSYYTEYFHLLESLSTVKSVVLVCDLPSADELMAEIFRDFFALVRRDLAKKVELFLADILVALIDESQSLPSEALDTLMSQFIDKNARIEHPAYRLAVQVCNSTADKLQRHVSQYFTDIIVSHAPEDDFDDIRNAHDLIKRLHHSCPGVLPSVIPQLEEELRAEDLTLRLIATQVLGDMFADKGGPDLVKKYPATWNAWIGRKNDKNVQIRLKVVEASKALLTNLPDLREVLEDMLSAKVMDPDDKVRAAACKLYSQLDYEAALHHVSEAQLRAVADRGKDKKQVVRNEALNSLGRLYSLAYPEIENNEASAIKQFAWIPEELLQITFSTPEARSAVERVMAEYVLPLPTPANVSGSKGSEIDEVAWTDRLLSTLRYLSDQSISTLLSLSGLKQMFVALPLSPRDFCSLVSSPSLQGGIIDEDEDAVKRKLDATIAHLSVLYPDRQKACEDLRAFAKLNENRLYKLTKTCMDPQTDVKALVKATSEFTRRLDQLSTTILPTMTVLLYRASYRVLNQSSIPTLLKRVQKGHIRQAALHAKTLLTFVSKHSPSLYRSHISELTKAIADEKHETLVGVALQALAGVVKWDQTLAPTDKRTNDRITRIVLQDNWRQSKFAARYLAFSSNKDEACLKAIESIASGISDGSDVPVARIAALAQFARYAPDAFESKSEVIMTFLLKRIFMIPTPPDPVCSEEWVEDEDVSDNLRAKLLSLKVCRNRGLAHSASEKALEIATPVLKMLATLLEHNGSLVPNVQEDPKVMSRMRLQAAISLLHLSTVESYSTAILPKFLRLAVVIQDSCYNVRINFLTKLLTLLQPRKISPRHNVIPFLTVHDPENEVKNMALMVSVLLCGLFINAQAVRVEHLEMTFIRLLHALAHHPDFNTTHDDLLDIAKSVRLESNTAYELMASRYVQFYLELMATQDNISLLYHLAMKGKTVRDPEGHTFSEASRLSRQNLYIICELAQDLIKTRAHAHSWTIQSYPGKVKLPGDILRPQPNAETSSKVLKTVYLPEETIAWLAELSRTTKVRESMTRV
ncbi:uncharacterized protein LACBIDRAFT_254367 [Laccaria bicolor S238N-H82]|uniref:Predicted protein n=1 Tax=Laccaria bicolor (strain S238N-H82 / ATCC MYA-4686) TaxID=486041 RepID=B0DTW3_LACBS|nr:uncharacterized protein LACBIDRAFT_254367 [Laccaria bicolor S238N-H82]EDR01919.1 predicted protein [Laccaria bicolor S238N-H82]|eukprot:XP_001887310.1 predicted protein [Laccaria bicolor S238N-H82]